MKATAARLLALALALVLAMGLLSGCGVGRSGPQPDAPVDSGPTEDRGAGTREEFAAFLNELFANSVGANGLTLNYTLVDPDAYGISRRIRAPLGFCSPESWKEDQRAIQEELNWLRTFDRESLSPEQKLTWDVLDYYLQRQAESAGLELHGDLLSPVNGIHTSLPILLAEFRFDCHDDFELYFSMLEDLPRYFREIILFEEYRAKAGYFMGDAQLDELLQFCRVDAGAAVGGLLKDSFVWRVQQLGWVDAASAETYTGKNEALVDEIVLPAYANLADRLEALRGSGCGLLGLSDLPRAEDYTRYLLRDMVGIDASPAEVDARLGARMDELLGAASALLQADPGLEEAYYAWQGPDMSPEEILADLRARCAADFPLPQQAECAVKEVSPALQEYLSPAFYLTPPIDSPEQNVIYINPAQLGQGSTLYTILAHEGYPGHLCQSVYAAGAGLDPVRSLLTCRGYSEGWATYVEFQYAYGWALPDNAPLARFAAALDELSLMTMAQVDLRVNAAGADEQQIAALLDEYGFDPDGAAGLVRTVAEDPLDYLCYAMGELEFLRLRGRAEQALGGAFEPIGFHRVMLEGGELPFPLLERRLDAWLAAQQAAA